MTVCVAGERVLVVDDVLATGGTAAADDPAGRSARRMVVGLGFLIELGFLDGRHRLDGYEIVSLITYE